jgi:hypothetical protein
VPRWLSTVVLVSAVGCAAVPYQYCGDLHTEHDAPLAAGEPQIEQGRPRCVVDALGWVVGVPSKILMLDRRVNNHDISARTGLTMQEYLAANRLDKVKVRLNEYAPWEEWKRLTHNESVGWPIRYTVGAVAVAGYTILPGRIFGGDQYNPYTNTISLYSDVPAMALYEGAHAKDYAQREHKGLYALADVVPGVGLLCHDARASRDAMGYLQENATTEELKEGYHTVWPVYAAEAVEPFAAVAGMPLVVPAVAVGHVAAEVKGVSIKKEEGQQSLERATCRAQAGPAQPRQTPPAAAAAGLAP